MKAPLCRPLVVWLILNAAALSAAPGSSITSIQRPSGEPPSITWTGVVGRAYRIEYRDSLQSGSWRRDPFPLRLTGSSMTWRESGAVLPSQRFYRVAEPDTLQFTNPGPGGGSFIMSAAVHPLNHDVVYFGGDIEGPFRTSDGGASFQRVTGNLAGGGISAGVYASQLLYFDPGNSGRLYLTSWNGLYRTDDEGRTWTELDVNAGTSIAGIAISPADSSLLLVGTGDVEANIDGSSAIYRSTDGGSTFVNVTETGVFANTDTTVHAILFDPLNPAVVYAASGEGILKSLDSGLSWSFMNNGLPASPIAHGLVGVVHEGAFRLFATLMNHTITPQAQAASAFVGGGVFRSADGAASWEDITSNLPRYQNDEESAPTPFLPYSWWRIVVDPGTPDNLFVGSENLGSGGAYENVGVYRCANALTPVAGDVAWTWAMPENAFTDMGWLDNAWWNDLLVGFLALVPGNPSTLYAGSDHLFKSSDGGQTWSEVYSKTVDPATHRFRGRGIEAMEPFSVAVDPNTADRWWVGYDDMGLFRTDDAGDTWFRIDDKQTSDNLGGTDCAASVAVDPTDSTIVYQGRNGGENDQGDDWNVGFVYKTVDTGQTWTQLGVGTLEGGRPQLLLLPGGSTGSRTIFAAIYGKGLYRSGDSGSSWMAADTGFAAYDKTHVWSLARHPSDNSILYAGIADGSFNESPADGGVYRSTDGGVNWTPLGGTAPSGQVTDLAIAPDGAVYAAASNVFTTHAAGTGTREGGVYRSSDNGANWTRVLDVPRADHVDVAPTDGNLVIVGVCSRFEAAATLNAGVYISRDAGANWIRESDGLTHTRLWLTRFHPANADLVFVGTGGGGLFVGSGAVR